MIMTLTVKCPYCGKDNHTEHLYPWSAAYMITCDKKERGCGGIYVARVEVEITARVQKVEGEG